MLDFAVVHAAIHDAVQAYDQRFEPYAVDVPDADGSLAAAVAKAAHDVLVNRFPGQAGALDLIYDNYLSDHGLAVDDPGVLIRSIAEMNLDNDGDIARLLALSWISVADAFITTWESKVYYSFWRPLTAIHEGDSDGNRTARAGRCQRIVEVLRKAALQAAVRNGCFLW